jgi:hypothetical protein
MATIALNMSATCNSVNQIKSSVMQISYGYTNGNGVSVTGNIPEFSSAKGIWTLADTATVGAPAYLSATEIQSQPIPQGIAVAISATANHTANNYNISPLPAGVKYSTQLPAGITTVA